MALDRARDHGRQAPAAGEDAADERVVDAELAALGVAALLGRRLAVAEDPLVARVEADQDELADVVQQGGGRELVAAGDVGEVGDGSRPRGASRPRGGGSAPAGAPRRRPAGRARRLVSDAGDGPDAGRRQSSTASGTLEIRPRGPPPLFAVRITAIAIAVSDSTSLGDARSPRRSPARSASRAERRSRRARAASPRRRMRPTGADRPCRSPPCGARFWSVSLWPYRYRRVRPFAEPSGGPIGRSLIGRFSLGRGRPPSGRPPLSAASRPSARSIRSRASPRARAPQATRRAPGRSSSR